MVRPFLFPQYVPDPEAAASQNLMGLPGDLQLYQNARDRPRVTRERNSFPEASHGIARSSSIFQFLEYAIIGTGSRYDG